MMMKTILFFFLRDDVVNRKAYIFPDEKWRAYRTPRRLNSAILVSWVFLFRKYVAFCLSAFAHKQMKDGRGIYDCGYVSVTINSAVGEVNELTQDTRGNKDKMIMKKLIKLVSFFSWLENLMVPIASSPCGLSLSS